MKLVPSLENFKNLENQVTEQALHIQSMETKLFGSDRKLSELTSKIDSISGQLDSLETKSNLKSKIILGDSEYSRALKKLKDEINDEQPNAEPMLIAGHVFPQYPSGFKNISNQHQPHVRIEFDDIRDVPKVWIDGEFIGDADVKPLVDLNIEWNTNGAVETHKEFDINYIDLDEGGGGQRKGIREGSLQ